MLHMSKCIDTNHSTVVAQLDSLTKRLNALEQQTNLLVSAIAINPFS